MEFPLKKVDLVPHFCQWLSKAVGWATGATSLNVISAGWVKSGLDIAFDEAKRVPLFEKAMDLQSRNLLWPDFTPPGDEAQVDVDMLALENAQDDLEDPLEEEADTTLDPAILEQILTFTQLR